MDLMALRRGLLELITHTSGGDPIPAGCEIGTFTVSENEKTHTVYHNFGTVPRCAIVLDVLNTTNYSDFSLPSNTTPMLLEALMTDPDDGVFDSTRVAGQHVVNNVWNLNMTSKAALQQSNTYSTYPASMTSTEVTFAIGRYYNAHFITGQTYIYILIK